MALPGQWPDLEYSWCSGFHWRCVYLHKFIYLYNAPENATHDNKVQRMPFKCWITMLQTHIHTYYAIFIFHGNSSYANALNVT
jgi:hypothetical protein